MESYPNLSFDSYDRLFPNQDVLPEARYLENLLPLCQSPGREPWRSTPAGSTVKLMVKLW
ncbi:TOTE conflict system archaeo-eukaryotic primase domain-containing protein [Alishewanella longhuensis]